MDKVVVQNGPWIGGVNSLISPLFLPEDNVAWSVNTLNRGGVYQTRPGFSILYDSTNNLEPRGLTLFTPYGKEPYLVKALGTKIRISPYPFTTWSDLTGITLNDNSTPVYFSTAIFNLQTNTDGSLTRLTPKPVLIIQDGSSRAGYWDGSSARHLTPTEMPIGTHMQWVGNRLWVANGPNLHASNLLEPVNWTEEAGVAGGGVLTFPGDITGLGVTSNFQSLIVFTDSTTSSVQAAILDRTLWGATTDFQKIVLADIGCVAGKGIVNQYGMTWWYSQGGLINLDEALLSYRTSKIHYKDEAMNRSKANLSYDLSGIALGAYGNFLMVSVPSGDISNFNTWVMDQSIAETESPAPPAWASTWTGVRPVQWVSGMVKGQSRCFCLSRDKSGNTGASANVWEAFIPIRKDFSMNGSTPVINDIQCSVETKYLSKDSSFKMFDFASLLIGEIRGTVNLRCSYASRHSGYLQVLDKDIISTVDTINSTDTIGNVAFSRVKQRRWIRTSTNEARISDLDAGVEDSEHTRNKDRGFSLLISWTGEMSLETVQLIMIPTSDTPVGRVEPDETTSRYVNVDGESAILTTAPLATTFFGSRISRPIKSISPRVEEARYSSI